MVPLAPRFDEVCGLASIFQTKICWSDISRFSTLATIGVAKIWWIKELDRQGDTTGYASDSGVLYPVTLHVKLSDRTLESAE